MINVSLFIRKINTQRSRYLLKSILGVTFLFIYFTSASVAQDPYIVKGVVTDTTSKVYLQNAVVTILNAKDSILVNFIRADHNGLFNCPISKPGMFILRVSYPGYVNYVEHFTLTTERKSINFGQLNLRLKSKLLKEIIVKGEIAAIKIKGDTTEFNAGSYLIKPNSKVEDLLKQLPGLQIDQNGNISANGESVKKVLVDGEEFFGDDPTLVTRNIRGDMVDKIQLYDKKSDQASFTGIDDGKTEKTINVKLKEDKKNGRFGKLKGGTGNDEYHELQAMANFFKHDQKFAFYAISGNNGKIGLNWQDNAKFGSPTLTEQGGMVLSDGVDGFDSTNGTYSGQGIPTAYSTGAHYNSKWREGKESLNVNYKGGYYEIEGKKDRLTQSTLPNGLISNNSNQLFSSSAIRQKLDATYEVKPNPSLAFKFSINGTLQHSKGDNIFNMVSRREDADLLNSGNRRLSGKKHETIIGSNVFASKRFKKDRRTLSLQLNYSIKNEDENQLLKSENNFFNNEGNIDSIQVIDQEKPNIIHRSIFTSSISYTEPLSPYFSLILNTGFSFGIDDSDRKTYDLLAHGKYHQPDTLFSNSYLLKQKSKESGFSISFNKEKTVFNIGLKALHSSLTQTNQMNLNIYKRNFINLNPQASYQYKFSPQKSVWINYFGTTQQPTLYQLQPLRDNTDPLNITIGNIELKPSFRNKLELRYVSYKVLSKSGVNIHGHYTTTLNPIVNNVLTDSLGTSTYQFINLKNRNLRNISLSIGYNKRLEKPDISFGYALSGSGNTYFNSINHQLNKTENFNYAATISVSKYKKDKFDLFLLLIPSYNDSKNSLISNLDNSGWVFDSEISFEYFLSKKLSVKTDGLFAYRQKTAFFNTGINRMIWTSSLNRDFLKDNSLRLSMTVNDLFNQNKGFNRSSFNNSFVQENYTTIKRYFMLSLIWDFNKMGNQKSK